MDCTATAPAPSLSPHAAAGGARNQSESAIRKRTHRRDKANRKGRRGRASVSLTGKRGCSCPFASRIDNSHRSGQLHVNPKGQRVAPYNPVSFDATLMPLVMWFFEKKGAPRPEPKPSPWRRRR